MWLVADRVDPLDLREPSWWLAAGGGGALTPVFGRCGWEFGLGYEKGGLSLIQELSEGVCVGGGGGV